MESAPDTERWPKVAVESDSDVSIAALNFTIPPAGARALGQRCVSQRAAGVKWDCAKKELPRLSTLHKTRKHRQWKAALERSFCFVCKS